MSKTGNGSKALKAGIGYTIGNVLIKGINFLTLPLFSRLLSTEEFGVYNIFISYDAILVVVVSLAIYMSFRSAKIEFKDIDAYISSVSLIAILIATLLLVVAYLFRTPLSAILKLQAPLIYLLIVYSLAGAIFTIYNVKLALDYSYQQYLKISFANSIGNIALSLFLILTFFSSQRDVGRILGATLSSIAIASIILVLLYKKRLPRFQKAYWSFAVRYSLPIVPHGISQVLLAQFDRIMIRNMVSNSAAGIYSLAGNVKLILTIITDSISSSWQTWFYEEIEKNHIKEIQERAKQIISCFVIGCVLLMAVSPELILLLGGRPYLEGRFVVVPMIMDAFILLIYNIIIPAEYYKKKTQYVMLGTLFATALNIITNYIFIQKYGFVAAAYTTLFSYICYLLLHIYISWRVVGFHIIEVPVLLLFSAVIGCSGAVDLVFVNHVVLRIGIGLLTAALFLLFVERRYKLIRSVVDVAKQRIHGKA